MNGGSIPTLSIEHNALEDEVEEERAPLEEILGLDSLTGKKSLGWCFRGCIEFPFLEKLKELLLHLRRSML